MEDALEGEIELLWLTAEVRRDRPSVMDEVSTGLWYLETRLLEAGARAQDALVRAFEDEFGVQADESAAAGDAAAHRQLDRRGPRRQSERHARGYASRRRGAPAT